MYTHIVYLFWSERCFFQNWQLWGIWFSRRDMSFHHDRDLSCWSVSEPGCVEHARAFCGKFGPAIATLSPFLASSQRWSSGPSGYKTPVFANFEVIHLYSLLFFPPTVDRGTVPLSSNAPSPGQVCEEASFARLPMTVVMTTMATSSRKPCSHTSMCSARPNTNFSLGWKCRCRIIGI